MPRFHLITGCSGAGKSSLLTELATRGISTVPEPGRRIVEAETDPASPRLPWNDLATFAEAAVALATQDLTRARDLPGPVFFDRGLIDAVAARWQARRTPDRAATDPLLHPPCYAPLVFLAPPWPEIHVTDTARPHGLPEARAEYDRLCRLLPRLGYRTRKIPRGTVAARADVVLRQIG